MEIKIDFSQVPYNYPLCLNRECPKADTCLRQLAWRNIPTTVKFPVIVSPTYLATLTGDCPHYRSAAKVRYVKGFMGLFQDLPYKQMHDVVSSLMGYFGRRTYYRVRKGERTLSPAEWQGMLNVLKRCGITHHWDFDAYTEDFDW